VKTNLHQYKRVTQQFIIFYWKKKIKWSKSGEDAFRIFDIYAREESFGSILIFYGSKSSLP
jgi:hypothetical protein